MAEPKKRLSKTRTNRRRARYDIKTLASTRCRNCGAIIRSHQVCPECGFYRGKLVRAKKPVSPPEEPKANVS